MGRPPKKPKLSDEEIAALIGSHRLRAKKRAVGLLKQCLATHETQDPNIVQDVMKALKLRSNPIAPSLQSDEKDEDDDEAPAKSKTRYYSKKGNSTRNRTVNDEHNEVCEVCDRGGDLMCCETCTLVFHLACLRPKVSTMPKGSWSCPHCIIDGSVEGDRAKARDALKAMWNLELGLASDDEAPAVPLRRPPGSKFGEDFDPELELAEELAFRDSLRSKTVGEITVSYSSSSKTYIVRQTSKRQVFELGRYNSLPDALASLPDVSHNNTVSTQSSVQDLTAVATSSSSSSAKKAKNTAIVASSSTAGTAGTASGSINTAGMHLHHFTSPTHHSAGSASGGHPVGGAAVAVITPLWCTQCIDNPHIQVCLFCGCTKCSGKIDSELLIMCDHCNRVVHTYCHNPPLNAIPSANPWYCEACRSLPQEELYGNYVPMKYEEGEGEYSWPQYGQGEENEDDAVRKKQRSDSIVSIATTASGASSNDQVKRGRGRPPGSGKKHIPYGSTTGSGSASAGASSHSAGGYHHSHYTNNSNSSNSGHAYHYSGSVSSSGVGSGGWSIPTSLSIQMKPTILSQLPTVSRNSSDNLTGASVKEETSKALAGSKRTASEAELLVDNSASIVDISSNANPGSAVATGEDTAMDVDEEVNTADVQQQEISVEAESGTQPAVDDNTGVQVEEKDVSDGKDDNVQDEDDTEDGEDSETEQSEDNEHNVVYSLKNGLNIIKTMTTRLLRKDEEAWLGQWREYSHQKDMVLALQSLFQQRDILLQRLKDCDVSAYEDMLRVYGPVDAAQDAQVLAGQARNYLRPFADDADTNSITTHNNNNVGASVLTGGSVTSNNHTSNNNTVSITSNTAVSTTTGKAKRSRSKKAATSTTNVHGNSTALHGLHSSGQQQRYHSHAGEDMVGGEDEEEDGQHSRSSRSSSILYAGYPLQRDLSLDSGASFSLSFEHDHHDPGSLSQSQSNHPHLTATTSAASHLHNSFIGSNIANTNSSSNMNNHGSDKPPVLSRSSSQTSSSFRLSALLFPSESPMPTGSNSNSNSAYPNQYNPANSTGNVNNNAVGHHGSIGMSNPSRNSQQSDDLLFALSVSPLTTSLSAQLQQQQQQLHGHHTVSSSNNAASSSSLPSPPRLLPLSVTQQQQQLQSSSSLSSNNNATMNSMTAGSSSSSAAATAVASAGTTNSSNTVPVTLSTSNSGALSSLASSVTIMPSGIIVLTDIPLRHHLQPHQQQQLQHLQQSLSQTVLASTSLHHSSLNSNSSNLNNSNANTNTTSSNTTSSTTGNEIVHNNTTVNSTTTNSNSNSVGSSSLVSPKFPSSSSSS